MLVNHRPGSLSKLRSLQTDDASEYSLAFGDVNCHANRQYYEPEDQRGGTSCQDEQNVEIMHVLSGQQLILA
jgi:hypothetical protein